MYNNNQVIEKEQLLTSRFKFKELTYGRQVDLTHSILDVYLKNSKPTKQSVSKLSCSSKKYMRIQMSWNKRLFNDFFDQFEGFSNSHFTYIGRISQKTSSQFLGEFGHLLIQSELNQNEMRKMTKGRMTGKEPI